MAAPDPLSSFHPAVGAWFREALGAPTRVQAMAWPRIASGDTTLLLAPTGSGKTLAAFLAAIDRLAREPEDDPDRRLRVLYVSPLKALAVDVERNLQAPLAGVVEMAARTGAVLSRPEVFVRTGDTPAQERAKAMRRPPDILITTPESLFLMLTSSQRERLAAIDTVIVDEIHQLVPSKRGTHLFLSLERLEALVPGRKLQRIGLSATQRPLEEVAHLLGGHDGSGRPRKVAIVDAGEKKALSITVEVPPPLAPGSSPLLPDDDDESFRSKSVWPEVHARLVERIRGARSTMVFVNSRRLAERLANALNETAGAPIALAHHGSVAKEQRRDIEDRLKAGLLPAIVATSSLELGIDMGAVDQVIQVEAPPSVASGIQRIGRASHHVGGVPSGVIVPKHKHDLVACAAASAGIEAGDVEASFFPRNPLDVLAQQIVAIAAVGVPLGIGQRAKKKKKATKTLAGAVAVETPVDDLWALVRKSAPFAKLPRSSFEGVLDMLSGRYPSDEFADLRPRITWDRARNVVVARAGAQRLAIQNAGTIPDRGLYGVFLKHDAATDGAVGDGSSKGKPSRRVGELDEEMVFELREGEVFMLGASSWQADEITRDRVLVTPAAGQPGKMPFWHGDNLGRNVAFGQRIGALLREVSARSPAEAHKLLRERHHLDTRAADGLTEYVQSEIAAAGALPTDTTVVVERVPDELGDLRVCVLTPFGSRVHAPWAMAALRRLREARAGDIEAVWSDDGIVFRVPGGEAPPPNELLFPSSDDIEDIVTRELGGSSLFAARFREAAARALLLPRQVVGKRTPLWAQRKRAADLLAVATQFPSFPIVLETYREVLRDAFDLPSLVEILHAIEARKIRVHTVDLSVASPFAASLMFSFVGNFLYDEDAPAAERRAQALTIDQAQLRELLGEGELRKLLDPEVVAEHERALQRRDRPLRTPDAVHDLLLWLGDLGEAELVARAADADAMPGFLASLVAERRLVRARVAGEARYVAVEDAARYRDALGVVLERGLPEVFLAPTKGALVSLAHRYARTHGPFTAESLAARFGVGVASAEAALEELAERGKVAAGAFLPLGKLPARRGAPAVEYCDVEVLRVLKQKTLAKLRKAIEPAPAHRFARFLVEWQGVTSGGEREAIGRRPPTVDALLGAIGRLEGCPVPASVLETEILPARVPGYSRHLLDQVLASGEVSWAGVEPIGHDDGRVALYLTEHEPLLARWIGEDARPSGALHDAVRAVFERRGAVFFPELARAVGGFPGDVLSVLWDLVWCGEVTNDTFECVRSLFRRDERRGRPGSHVVRGGPRGAEGRWSLRRARWEREPSSTERATAIARSLLERYGVVLREAAQAEGLPGGFANVYDVLRAMEDQGRVRRGYFVARRGATQFALPGAEERLRARDEAADADAVLLSAPDPANPYGALVPWPDSERGAQRVAGAHVVLARGKLVAWLSRGARAMSTFVAADEPDHAALLDALGRALAARVDARGRSMMIETIDGAPARQSAIGRALAPHGFAPRQGALVRLPERPPPAAAAPAGDYDFDLFGGGDAAADDEARA
jgi:ATP-dependent Lhr-like helicase